MTDALDAAPELPLWRVERILSGDFREEPDQGVLVVDKPSGMPVYGGDESLSHSVVDRLAVFFEANDGAAPELSVHQRLDQETSGALFFVTDKARDAEFAQAMEGHAIERVYHAVVAPSGSGRLPLPDEKRLEVWLSFDRGRAEVTSGKPSRGAAARKKAKRAVTHYRVVRRVGERVLLELRLETGRTHQIRATLAYLGFPVVGDKLYGGAPAPRLMLHAKSLAGGPLSQVYEAPVPSCFEDALTESEEFPEDFRTALADAACRRAPLRALTETYRLVNGAGDGLPGMTVDAYGAFAVLNVYDHALVSRCQELAQAIFELGFCGVYLKQRKRADLRAQDQKALAPEGPLVGKSAPRPFCVSENGMNIQIDLEDGLSTGLFVDMRDNRMRARSWAKAGRMLNLFCYTSSFGVSSAIGGAQTTNVDLSAKAIERSRANFEENGLDPHAHRFFKEDAMKFLERAVRRGDQYDFIVLDPPSFSTVGKGTFSVKSKYGRAAEDCFRVLAPRGRLLCVTNHTKTSPRAFRKTIEAACVAAGRGLASVKELKPGLDCPEHPSGPWPSKSLLVQIV